MNAFIPENLDLEEILIECPPDFNYHPDNFRYLCGLINTIPSYWNGIYKDDDYVSLNSKRMQKVIHDYRDYLSHLLEIGVLESDRQYIQGSKSIGYRFVKEYRTPVKVIEITKTSLCKAYKARSFDTGHLGEKYNYLSKWFNPELKIDFSASINYLREQYRQNQLKETPNSLVKFNSGFIAAHRIANNDFYFNIDKTAGRCHTNLTSVKSELRNFITYEGAELVCIDIKNSQPCLSGLLFNPDFYQDSKNSETTVFNAFSDEIATKKELGAKITPNTHTPLSSIMLVNSESNDPLALAERDDLKTYLEIIQRGDFYEILGQEITRICGIPMENREKVKDTVFMTLFSDNRFIGQDEAAPKRVFRDVFPSVYRVFSSIKRHKGSLLAIILQRIEAKIMLDNVAKELSMQIPELPIFTIHDSIVVPKGFEKIGAELIRKYVKEKTGMRPSLKFELWSPCNLSDSSDIDIAA